MNERIDKLLVKAGAYFGGDGVVYDTFDPKKFAELIVRECADVGALGMSCTDKGYIKRGVLAHFGVEE